MSRLIVQCVTAPDGVAVSPCGTMDGVALVPTVVQDDAPPELDFNQSVELFVWAFGLVLFCWVTGLVVGIFMRVIRSA